MSRSALLPERALADRGARQDVRRADGRLAAEVAVVEVDDRLGVEVEPVVERPVDRLELLLLVDARGAVVVAQADAGRDERAERAGLRRPIDAAHGAARSRCAASTPAATGGATVVSFAPSAGAAAGGAAGGSSRRRPVTASGRGAPAGVSWPRSSGHGGSGADPRSARDLLLRQRPAEVRHRPAGRRAAAAPTTSPRRAGTAASAAPPIAASSAAMSAPPEAERSASSTRALSFSVCRRPTSQVRRVRHRLVVEVDRVLRREHEAAAEGAALLEHREDRLLRGRGRGRRHVAEHLVHVGEHAQVGRARLRAHPRDELREDERHRELALVVGEVREVDDRRSAAVRRRRRASTGCRAGRPRPRRRRWGRRRAR